LLFIRCEVNLYVNKYIHHQENLTEDHEFLQTPPQTWNKPY
jgi:hypothetical protein